MDPSSLVTALENGGALVAVVLAVIFGWLVPKWTYDKSVEDLAKKDAEIASLQEALALERQRSNDATQAGAVTNQLISGLVRLASNEHHADHSDAGKALPPGTTLDLTGKDLGL